MRSLAFFGLLKHARGQGSGLPDCSKCHNQDLRDDWGCDKDSLTWSYDLGSEQVKRCPNALAKGPVIRACWSAYAAYKRGLTPNNRGMRQETAFYSAMVSMLESLEIESETWFQGLMEKKSNA